MPLDQGNFAIPVAFAPVGDEVLRVLVEARAWLDDPSHWCKHASERNGRTCAIGAIQKFNGGNWGSPHRYLEAQVPSMRHACVINFNDRGATTHADVLALFDRAIAARTAELVR